MASKSDYAEAATAYGLMVAERNGQNIGIGTRAELEAQIADDILPSDTVLREARSDDF